jgi:hypothetical protein
LAIIEKKKLWLNFNLWKTPDTFVDFFSPIKPAQTPVNNAKRQNRTGSILTIDNALFSGPEYKDFSDRQSHWRQQPEDPCRLKASTTTRTAGGLDFTAIDGKRKGREVPPVVAG